MSSPIPPFHLDTLLSSIASLRTAAAPAPIPFAENFLSIRNAAISTVAGTALGIPATVPASPAAGPLTPPTPTYLAQLAADLAASDALFQQRKYSDAYARLTPGGSFTFGGYAHVYVSIQQFVAGGGDYVPELMADAKHAGLGGSECLRLMELFLPAAQSYAIVTVGNPLPLTLSDAEIAYVWLQWSTVALDWGNALFRNSDVSNNDLTGALNIYQSVVAVDLSLNATPPPAGARGRPAPSGRR